MVIKIYTNKGVVLILFFHLQNIIHGSCTTLFLSFMVFYQITTLLTIHF